jgi:hypothetical protein
MMFLDLEDYDALTENDITNMERRICHVFGTLP